MIRILKNMKRLSVVAVIGLVGCLLFASGCFDDNNEDQGQTGQTEIVAAHEAHMQSGMESDPLTAEASGPPDTNIGIDIDDYDDIDELVTALELKMASSLASQLRRAVDDMKNRTKAMNTMRDLVAAVEALKPGEKLVLDSPDETELAESFPAVQDLMTMSYDHDFRTTQDEALDQSRAELTRMSDELQIQAIKLQSLVHQAEEFLRDPGKVIEDSGETGD